MLLRSWQFLSIEIIRPIQFVLQKKQYRKACVFCTRNLHELVWDSGFLDNKEIPSILLKTVEGKNFATVTEKSKSPSKSMEKEVENLKDHG